MAKSRTANGSKAKSGAGGGRRYLWLFLIVIAALAVAAFSYRAPITGYAGAGAAYSARVACSCRFIGNRTLEDCAKDKLPGMELISLKEDADTKSVTARFPLIASETAKYREGYGCVLKKWED